MKMTWGFLSAHRMFRAVVFAIPRGYMVELLVGRDRVAWAVAEGRTVDAAMRRAAAMASKELALRGAVMREKARSRIRRRKRAS